MNPRPAILYAALVLLFVLHNDWWFWNDGRLILGLPVGLLYHLVFMLVTAAVMALIVTFAWPDDLEVDEPGGEG
jgi:hypothetical protein